MKYDRTSKFCIYFNEINFNFKKFLVLMAFVFSAVELMKASKCPNNITLAAGDSIGLLSGIIIETFQCFTMIFNQ